MYNRYVFSPDGSCRKDQIPEPEARESPGPEVPPEMPPPDQPEPAQFCSQNCQYRRQSPLDFLKQMMPQGFDTGDLIVVLLLLLMAGDSRQDRDSALLTLALYFIL